MTAAEHVLALVVTLAVFDGSGQATGPDRGALVKAKIKGPETLLDLDTRQLKGVPTRLAWAPDGTSFYIRLSQFDRWANETVAHGLVDVANRRVTVVAGVPDWAERYWEWKAGQASPAERSWRITYEAREELVKTTNVPREGTIGMNVSDPNTPLSDVVALAALANQKTRFETLRLGGLVLDQAVNSRILPGRTFSWSPPAASFIAYVNAKGRLAVSERSGDSREVKGTKNVLLPAWSDDGQRIAYIEKRNDGRYALRLVRIE
ncbi:MAG: hypothetical protein AB1806_09850 [Acidobacteriota bacterium]